MHPLTWTIRSLAVIGAVALTVSAADAQPKANPQPKGPQIIVHPQLNSWPGIPAWQLQPPAFNPGPFYNPAVNNPWMNQTRVIPVSPFVNDPLNNPWNNPLNNPFNNPFNHPFNNPWMTGVGPTATFTPPIAIQQRGQLLWKGPDLQVNPWSGTVYRPLTGVAQTADGSIFYRVPGSGLPTVTGAYSPGSGLYFDPKNNTFLNPSSGVLSKPGVTNVFVPWIP